MANSVSGRDESNPALWLATRAGRMELSCPLGTARRVPQEKFPGKPYNKSFSDHACSIKMAGYSPRSFFASFIDLDYVSVHKRTHTIKELGQYPAISVEQSLVNIPYVLTNYLYVILFLSTGDSNSSDDELRFSHVCFVENEVRVHSTIYNREIFVCCCFVLICHLKHSQFDRNIMCRYLCKKYYVSLSVWEISLLYPDYETCCLSHTNNWLKP